MHPWSTAAGDRLVPGWRCAGLAGFLLLGNQIPAGQALPSFGREERAEAAPDHAVDTSDGPWCTGATRTVAGIAGASAGITVEGWLRPLGRNGGVVLEVAEPLPDAHRVRLALTREGRLRLERGPLGRHLGDLSVPLETWTHYRLSVTNDAARLDLWDVAGGERSSRLPDEWFRASTVSALCLGADSEGKRPFRGWIDQTRLWSGQLADEAARRFRHRKLSSSHPNLGRLLGSWAFSAGSGNREDAEQGDLGPLESKQPRWVSLPRLTYGPILRSSTPTSVRVLFGARPPGAGRVPWQGSVELWTEDSPSGRPAVETRPVDADEGSDFVAHVTVEGLEPQSAYVYVPLIDGRSALGNEAALPRFESPPDLGGRNFDFTVAFLADQHTPDTPHPVVLDAYGAASQARPLFWAQLGDVMTGSIDGTPEAARDPDTLRAIWERNFGRWNSPQAEFARTYPLNLATISDHEIADNYSMNWHHQAFGGVAPVDATLDDRIAQYDRSLKRWWNFFGWGPSFDDALGRIAAQDRGETVMGKAYAQPGLYHSYRPCPFVEFFVLDTTSYRGDPYQVQARYAKEAANDTDHARYPWNPSGGPAYIFGDRAHGGNETTDGVRSWLGPRQRDAFLATVRESKAQVVVVVAGYPLHSLKFEEGTLYWPGRESGFDFAREASALLDVLERLDRLVLWVHGDGHSPALVRLRRNVYQLQTGATLLTGPGAGHHAASLESGQRSSGELLAGGRLLAGHQPDLTTGDGSKDLFTGGLDRFEGYLRLYFHPGRDLLRSSEAVGVHRGAGRNQVEIRLDEDPAVGRAATQVGGRVARLKIQGRDRYSIVAGYRHADGRAVFELADPVVLDDPEEFRILVDGAAWVRADWVDARGKPWPEFTAVLRVDR